MASIKTALRDLARRWKALDGEIKTLNKQIETVVHASRPSSSGSSAWASNSPANSSSPPETTPNASATRQPSPNSAASRPQPASSGRTTGRHRLNRSGDRAANSALYIVTIVRLRHHEPTRAYVERRTAEGLSKREIIRCLKRYIAREVFANLPRPQHDSLTNSIQPAAA